MTFEKKVNDLRAQTIQLFLPKGEPRGVRQAEITTRTVRVYDIPRGDLSSLPQEVKLNSQGLYFLVNTDEDDLRVYIGESDNVKNRLPDHEKNKDFWDRVIVAISSSDSWTKSHVILLEHFSIDAAVRSNHYKVENSQAGKLSNVPRPLRADCEEYFETIELLVSTLGYRFLEVPRSSNDAPASRTYYLTRKGSAAKGVYENGTVTVLAGSSVRLSEATNPYGNAILKRQQKLIESGVIGDVNGKFEFLTSHVFQTPSGAADCILGVSANGWVEWKDSGGKKLNERRQAAEALES